jgi:hypothetical protein
MIPPREVFFYYFTQTPETASRIRSRLTDTKDISSALWRVSREPISDEPELHEYETIGGELRTVATDVPWRGILPRREHEETKKALYTIRHSRWRWALHADIVDSVLLLNKRTSHKRYSEAWRYMTNRLYRTAPAEARDSPREFLAQYHTYLMGFAQESELQRAYEQANGKAPKKWFAAAYPTDRQEEQLVLRGDEYRDTK